MKAVEAEIHYNPNLTQIINGEEVMSPSPKSDHQDISFELAGLLKNHVRLNDLGKVYLAPLDVILDDEVNRLQPDILFVSTEKANIVQGWVYGAPDLVVEIVSPGSVMLDTVTKKNIYQQHHVPELWLVFPKRMTVEVYSLLSGRYELFGSFTPGQSIKSKLLDKFECPVESIFIF